MLFCESCNCTTAEERCPACGNPEMRAVKDEDFCFFALVSAYDFERLAFTFKANAIEAVDIPFYSKGVSLANAGRVGEKKVYIRYKDTEAAREIYERIICGEERP